MKDFKVKKTFLIKLFLIVTFLIPIYVIFITHFYFSLRLVGQLIVSFLPFLALLWAYISTKYSLSQDKLYIKSTFLKITVEVNKITKIKNNTTLWVGIKPALATNGMIIYYNSFDTVYIAPNDNLKLITALKNINSNILIE